jgi:flagella basal body P-ring formation protein FlgA
VRVIAVVRVVRSVVVAARPLNQGAYVRPDDVRLEPRVFDQSPELGLGSASDVVGHQMATYVPAGQMLARKDVKHVDLVKRSQRVHVVSSGTGVRFRLTGVALDSGSAGDRVRVRLGESRDERQIVTGIVTEFGTVSVGEPAPVRVASAEVLR